MAFSFQIARAVAHVRDMWRHFTELDSSRATPPQQPEWLTNWLFIQMVSTPTSEMFFLNTPGEIQRAKIGLVGDEIDDLGSLSQRDFIALCNNVYEWVGAFPSDSWDGTQYKTNMIRNKDIDDLNTVILNRGDEVNYRYDTWENCEMKWADEDIQYTNTIRVSVNGPKRSGSLNVEALSWILTPSKQYLWVIVN